MIGWLGSCVTSCAELGIADGLWLEVGAVSPVGRVDGLALIWLGPGDAMSEGTMLP